MLVKVQLVQVVSEIRELLRSKVWPLGKIKGLYIVVVVVYAFVPIDEKYVVIVQKLKRVGSEGKVKLRTA